MESNENNQNIDENIDEHFEESEGEGIDDENLTNPETGIGFDSGTDIVVQPEPTNFEQPEFEQPEFEQPEFEQPEFEQPEFEFDPFGFDLNLIPLDTNDSSLLTVDDLNFIGNNYFLPEGYAPTSHTDIEVARGFIEINNENEFFFTTRSDNLYFDEEYYLEQNPDLAAADVDPITHFSQFGISEGREHRVLDVTDTNNEFPYTGLINDFTESSINNSTRSGNLYFDEEYYLEQNPDLAAADVDAITHFAQFGISEGREHRYVSNEDLSNPDPNIRNISIPTYQPLTGIGSTDFGNDLYFDEEYYLEQNPDVAAAGVDPYEHYISFGQSEGRNPNNLFLNESQTSIELANWDNLELSNDFV